MYVDDVITQIAKFMGPTWVPPGSCRPQMGPMLAPWTLLSGYVSVATSDERQKKLQLCVDNVHQWYYMNRLIANKNKSVVMVIGSKAQLQSLDLDQFQPG